MFTRQHYNAIYKHNQKLIDELSAVGGWHSETHTEQLINKRVLDGIVYAHNCLGKLFAEDNPNFKPELWQIDEIKDKDHITK